MARQNPDEERARKKAKKDTKHEDATERRLQKLKADAAKAKKKGKPLSDMEKFRRAVKRLKD